MKNKNHGLMWGTVCFWGLDIKHVPLWQKAGDLLQNMIDTQRDEAKKGKQNKGQYTMPSHSHDVTLCDGPSRCNQQSYLHCCAGLTDHEIISQGIVSLFGGYDTSASTLSFVAYCLARNPEVMKRLQDEIDSTFPEVELKFPRNFKLASKL